MPATNPEGWPWGLNRPTVRSRVVVALIVATCAAMFSALDFRYSTGGHSDFGPVWFGARAMLAGHDPYQLIGPGRVFDWHWRMTYPATAMVLMLPFAALAKESEATAVFIFASAFLLCLGATRRSWHRLPGFASVPFIVSTGAGQWSCLLAASWFLPELSVFWSAKPSIAISLVPSWQRRRMVIAIAAAIVALAVSIAMLPGWIGTWLSILASSKEFHTPLLWPGGFALSACLLRYRRPEAWFLLLLAAVPQSIGVYDFVLILLIIPDTYAEACVLSLLASGGAYLLNLVPTTDHQLWMTTRGMLLVATAYLPAAAIILRRPNVSADSMTTLA